MMIATECPSAEELRALSTGRLADERSNELLEHIRGCATCRSALETVADGEDSLIASLRAPDALSSFDDEPGCKLAMAKALGVLANASGTATDAAREYLPKSIGEYEIVRPLGSGGMGSVFLARHTKLGREVALKVLAGHRLGDPRMRERFEAEMRAVGRLSHPNIVTAHDAREVDGTAVLVTEYIDGFDLGQLAQRTGPLEIAEACEIVRQVAVALAYTSGQGFVHRDVKPSNIMLSRSGEVKLLDLGLARFQLEDFEQVGMTGTGQTMGTADYVAPEQVTDSRSVDVRADIYSLGCTLFKLLCGMPPFADAVHATAFAKMTAHVSEPPPSLAERLPNAPPGLAKLVTSMLAKEPSKRPQSPQAVADKLAPFTQGADLERLAVRADALEPIQTLPHAAHPSKRPASHSTLPLLRRGIPLWIALASGIAGILLGILLGILIKIEYPDGTIVSLDVPPGSKVTLEEPLGGKPNSSSERVAETDARPAVREASKSSPLQFAISVDTRQLSYEAMRAAIEELTKSKQAGPVVTDIGTWYPLAESSFPTDPIIGMTSWTHQGQRYALTRNDREGTIGWDAIEGHLAVTASKRNGETQIELNFDEDLFAKIHNLTKDNLHRHLAIILDNEIISAPIVQSGLISSRAMLVGNFTEQQIERLHAALGGLLVEPKQEIREASVDEGATSNPFDHYQGLWRVMAVSEKQERTRENLKTIGLAFHNFHDTYGKLPGSINRREGAKSPGGDKSIQPFSWRVAILPFIGEEELFEQYRFDEPWDSEHNRMLLTKMPAVYQSPYRLDPKKLIPAGETHYQGFVGEKTALGTADGVRFQDITDGTSPTLLIVESQATVPWTMPQDLSFEKPEDAQKVLPFENVPLNFLTADGAVHEMEPVDWEKLAKLITRNGGEPVQP